MKKVAIGKSLDKEMSLWRYMSIEKFIDLISNKTLYMTPLSSYQSTDPFEGFIPKVAFEALTDIHLKHITDLENVGDKVECFLHDQMSSDKKTPTKEQKYLVSQIKESIRCLRDEFVSMQNKLYKSTRVHCWYHSEQESEAMWKLYSDSGKGIAIKTTVSSLVAAIDSCQPSVPLRIGRVKYLDFLSEKLTPKECVTDGVTSPLLKRQEYAHENEVRLYSVDQSLTKDNWKKHEPTAALVNIDLSTLIEAIYISPYVEEPFISSVYTLCELFQIPREKIIKSKLLDNYEKALLGYVHVK